MKDRQKQSGPIDTGQINPEDLSPEMLALISSLPPAAQAEMFGGSGSAEPKSLAELLVETSMTTIGRQGMTGQSFQGELPHWAKDLDPEVLGNPDFDPYFGIVSQPGDERVYWDEKELQGVGQQGGDAPLAPGMARPDGETDYARPPTSSDQLVAEATGEPVAKPDAISGSGDEWRSGGQRAAEDVETPGEKTGRKGKDKKVDKTLTALQAMNLPYTWDEEEIADAMKRMRQAGINVTSFDRGEGSLLSVWGALVDRAAMTYGMSEGARKVTPWDVLDMYKSEAQANGTFTNYQGGTESVVRRSVAEITEGQAWDSLRTTVSQMLGRDPSDQELRDYTYRMNQLAAQNPEISKTIAKYKNGEVVSESTSTTGGFTGSDMAQEAYEDAQSNPEYAEYQSATTYFNATLSALGAIGQT